MKVVVLGANGQLGSEFSEFLKTKNDVTLLSFTHKELDILDFPSLIEKFDKYRPDVVINCAAYTNVERAETEKDAAFSVNALGAKNVAAASYAFKAKIVYFSTDYVFDGEKDTPYMEFDSANPISVYGASKLEGENLTKEVNPNHLILRISWLYGKKGRNFPKVINELAEKKDVLKIVSDQVGTPTYARDVVRQTWLLIKRKAYGTYHTSNNGECSWFEFAKKFFEIQGKTVKIAPIKTNEFKTLAKRPKYSVMDNYLLRLEGIDIMRNWEDALRDFIINEWSDK